MYAQKQPLMWDGYNNGIGLGSPSYSIPSPINANFAVVEEPSEDRDLFFTGGSYYAVRVEQETTHRQPGHYPYSEMDNTAVPVGDGHLDDEETVNGPHDYGTSDDRVLQLEMELENLRADYEQLVTELQQNEQGAGTEVEEIIEEEVRTIKENRPSVKLEESVHLESVPPPPASTREVGIQSPPVTYRTMATMAVPESPTLKRCFAVNVRPSTNDVGVMSLQPLKREFGCTAVESDAMVSEWVENNLRQQSANTRKLITHLLRTSYTNRESFVHTVLGMLKKETRTVGTEVKPQQRQQSTSTPIQLLEVPVVEAPKVAVSPPAVLTVSQMVEARPLLVHKSVMTSRSQGIHVGVATESALFRSQGCQTSRHFLDITTSGVQTDHPPGLVDRGVHPVLENVQRIASSVQTTVSMQQRPVESEVQTEPSDTTSTTVRKTIESRTSSTVADSRLLSEAIQKAMEQSSECTRTTHLRSTRALSPTELQRLFQAGVGSTSPIPPEFVQTQETTSHTARGPYTKSPPTESCTVSTERRVVDEQSFCHLVPNDVNLDELARGDSATRESILARSKPVVSSHVVRHYQPSVEVVHHVTEQSSQPSLRPLTPIQVSPPSGPTQGADVVTSPISPKSYEIPVFHASSVDQGPADVSARGSIAHSPEMKHFWSETVRTPGVSSLKETTTVHHEGHSTREYSSVTHHPTSRFTDIRSTSHTSTVFPGGSVSTPWRRSRNHSGSSSTRAPSRNYSFNISDEVTKTCQSLAAQYRANQPSSARQSSELDKLTKICFELSSFAGARREQLEDFFAILHEYHPELLRSVVQSTNEQGDTCLHLAVGHGAWDVVNLILDSGYAEPDRLNRAGYSPIMVASLGKQLNALAINTMDRLFRMGDVNFRSAADTQLTPLMLAAQNGTLEVFDLLLRHGAMVNMQDLAGNTALMFAIQQGNHAIISTLLTCPDLDLHLRDNRGDDALAIAMQLEDDRVIHMIKCALEVDGGSEDRSQRPNTSFPTRRDVHEILRDMRSTHLYPLRPKTLTRLL